MNNRNTDFQDSTSQANQLVVDRITEQLSFSHLLYGFPDAQHVKVSVDVTDSCSLPIEVVSIWAKDTAVTSNQNYGETSTSSFVFQPGQTQTITGTISINGVKSTDAASCTSWLVTARGRTFSTTSGGSGSIGSGGGGNGQFSLDGFISASGTVGSNTMTLNLNTNNAYDVLYLSWVGSSGQTINSVTTSLLSPNTSPWTFRRQTAADGGAGSKLLETYYAISSIPAIAPYNTYTITVTMSNTAGNCAAFLFGISGADIASPFDPNTSIPAVATGGSGVTNANKPTITTSNANDFIISALGVENGNQNWQGLWLPQPASAQRIGYGVSGSACFTADGYYLTSAPGLQNPGLQSPDWAWQNAGTWGSILDAVTSG